MCQSAEQVLRHLELEQQKAAFNMRGPSQGCKVYVQQASVADGCRLLNRAHLTASPNGYRLTSLG